MVDGIARMTDQNFTAPQEDFFRTVVQSCYYGIVTADRQFRVTYVNSSAERIFAANSSQLVGRTIPQIHEERRIPAEKWESAFEQVQRLGQFSYIFSTENNGKTSWLEAHVTGIYTPMGDLSGFVTFLHDVTERTQIEEELRMFAASVEQSNRELAQFAYVASHDLQEPIRNMNSFCELLRQSFQDKLNVQGNEYLSYIMEYAERIQNLISDLLTYSRVETRGKPLARVDMNQLAAEVLGKMKERIQTSGAAVRLQNLPHVMGDQDQLAQVLEHLIDNAIKFRSAASPEIRIDSNSNGDNFWRISVRDNGIGIDPRYHERIFYMFQKLHPKQEYPGTGIGLAIGKKIVERHQGKMWVESQLSEGSTFHFTLPAVEDAVAKNTTIS